MTIRKNLLDPRKASVEFRSVTKRYGHVTAVDDISFTIQSGQLMTLLGPSGCGKTTTLRMIAGLEMPSEGVILIAGEDVTLRSAADRNVSMVFQSYALFPHMSVLENVAYGPNVQGLKKGQAEEKAASVLDLVGLKGLGKRMPSELSGGQQQRVAVARALVLEPDVLLFDEPLSNLDAKLRRRVREDIRDLQQRLNLTVAYVTHDQEEALAVSDEIIVMNNARIAQRGTPHALYEEPADLFVVDFIGDANILDVEIDAVTDEQAHISLGPIRLALPSRGIGKGAAKLAIRPDAISLTHADAIVDGIVKKAFFLGRLWEYTIDTQFGDLFVTIPGRTAPYPVGAGVGLRFDHAGMVLVPYSLNQ
jgi:iron(III) transport system ATP-binding protein